MRNRRRTWLLRRLVLGLAVAAMVAPTAQAALDESDTVRSENGQSAVVIQGDDKTFAAVPAEGAIMVRGDDKVIQPAPSTGLVSDQYGYRRALPQDYTSRIVAGDYGTLPPVVADRHVAVGDYGVLPAQPSDRVVQPGDYGLLPATGGDETILVGHPRGGFQAEPSDVAWGGIAAALGGLGVALAALLAFGAVRSTRRVGQPATA